MCTVSFVHSYGTIVITSNRDEKTIRPSAVPPKTYAINGKQLLFPKDPKAGGTWFAADAKGTVAVLLNGAAEKHTVALPYRKSRGLIVLDVISSASPKDFWEAIDLDNIEPFTLVLYQHTELFQLRWNGSQKETTPLDPEKNHIWSSSTLYPEAIREQRQHWFHTFLQADQNLSGPRMLHFHRDTEGGNLENGLIINRMDQMKTLSITQAVIEKNKWTILHCDLIAQQEYSSSSTTI